MYTYNQIGDNKCKLRCCLKSFELASRLDLLRLPQCHICGHINLKLNPNPNPNPVYIVWVLQVYGALIKFKWNSAERL